MRRAITCAVVAVASTVASAHEFWIAPSTLSCQPNATVKLNLMVGDSHDGVALPRDPLAIESFVMRGPDGKRRDVPGLDGRSPAGVVRPVEPGTHVVAYRSVEARVDIDPRTFERYLFEEGLAAAQARRTELVTKNATLKEAKVTERFSRCAKAIITVGNDKSASYDAVTQPVGLTLELTPETDLATIAREGQGVFRLTYESAPVADAQVLATTMNDSECLLLRRTDANGRVTIPFKTSGAWRLHAVHMFEMPDASDPTREWHSMWTSLVLECASAQDDGSPASAPNG